MVTIKAVESRRTLLLAVAVVIISQGLYWAIWAILDHCCRTGFNSMIETALNLTAAWYPSTTLFMLGALAVVFLANLGRWLPKAIRKETDWLTKSRQGSGETETKDADRGLGESIGFDVQGSPRTNLKEAKSLNYGIGFRLRESEESDLSQSVAVSKSKNPGAT